MNREEIVAELRTIESKHDCRILFAAESGSRAWGFPSPDSDYDIRFFYVHPLNWYLRLDNPKDTLQWFSGDLARIFHRVSTAAAQSGMYTALRL